MNKRIDAIGLQNEKKSRLTREQGHEFMNIFSIISANAEMVAEELGAAGQLGRRLARIIEACRRGEGLVHRIRNPEFSDSQPVDDIFETTPSPSHPSGRVVVVDDESDVVEIISRYLMKEGLRVQGVTDSRQALEMLRADPFCCDLVITDLDMPLLTGTALCEKVHAIRPELPIIIITGYDRHISGTQNSDLGIKHFLLKPLNRGELLTVVRRLLTS